MSQHAISLASIVSMGTTIMIHQNFIEALVDESTKWKRNFCLYLSSLVHSLVACTLYGYIFWKTPFSEYYPDMEFAKIDYILWGVHMGYFISDTYEMVKCKNWGFLVHHIMGMAFLCAIFKNNYGGLLLSSMINAETTAILVNVRYLYFKQFRSPLPYVADYVFWVLYMAIRLLLATVCLIHSLYYLKYNYYDGIYLTCSVLYLMMSSYWGHSWWKQMNARKNDTEKNK